MRAQRHFVNATNVPPSNAICMSDALCLDDGAKNSCREDTLRACRITIYFILFISFPAPHLLHNVLIMILLHFWAAHVCIPHELRVYVCLVGFRFFFLIAAEWLLSVRRKCTALELIEPLLKYVFFLFLCSYVRVSTCMCVCMFDLQRIFMFVLSCRHVSAIRCMRAHVCVCICIFCMLAFITVSYVSIFGFMGIFNICFNLTAHNMTHEHTHAHVHNTYVCK